MFVLTRSAKNLISLIFISTLFCGCGAKHDGSDTDNSKPIVSVTNSWLECAVNGIAGDKVRITRLLPPGNCPGHFDISPRMVDDIRASSLVLRFDFQAGLDSQLHSIIHKGTDIIPITAPEGLCLPASYLISSREVCESLVEEFPDWADLFQKNLGDIESSLKKIEEKSVGWVKKIGIADKPALCSKHQAYFCRWLGLNIIAEFDDLDDVPPSEIQALLEEVGDKQVAYIIGNLQGSRAFSNALGERFNAPVVVLSNFPDMSKNEDTFKKLVMNNIYKFKQAAER